MYYLELVSIAWTLLVFLFKVRTFWEAHKISENQHLEKLRSVSNLEKISGPAHLDFFLDFLYNSIFFLGGDLKNLGLQDLKFSKVWSRPWFSEIKAQIKRPSVRINLKIQPRWKKDMSLKLAFDWTWNSCRWSKSRRTIVRVRWC